MAVPSEGRARLPKESKSSMDVGTIDGISPTYIEAVEWLRAHQALQAVPNKKMR